MAHHNQSAILKLFTERFGQTMSEVLAVQAYFVTGSPNAVKFLVKDYSVLTFYEFDKVLADEYAS